MTWLNVIAGLILSQKGLKIFGDYERQKKLGLKPVFDPEALGIQNAGTVWYEHLNTYKQVQKEGVVKNNIVIED